MYHDMLENAKKSCNGLPDNKDTGFLSVSSITRSTNLITGLIKTRWNIVSFNQRDVPVYLLAVKRCFRNPYGSIRYVLSYFLIQGDFSWTSLIDAYT